MQLRLEVGNGDGPVVGEGKAGSLDTALGALQTSFVVRSAGSREAISWWRRNRHHTEASGYLRGYGARVNQGPADVVVGPRPDLGVLATAERLAAVQQVLHVWPVSDRLNRLVRFSADLMGVPYAQVSLVGMDEQVVAAAHGLELTSGSRHGPLQDSLCTVTAASGQPLVVTDARSHPWVNHLPPVRSGAVGSYLGVLLTDEEGHVLGSLCAYDSAPRAWTPQQVGQLSGLAELVADELARSVAAAAADRARLRTALAANAARLGSFVYDLGDTGEIDWDERMESLHGFAPGTFDGTLAAFEAVVHPDDVEHTRQRLAQARETLSDLTVEYRVLLPDGQVRWIHVRGRVVPDESGKPSHVLGAAYDVSTERSLRDELTRLMETMPAALVRLDRHWTIAYVNANAEAVYRRPRNELVGRDLWEAFPELAGTIIEDVYRRAMSSGNADTVEAHFRELDAYFEVRVWPDTAGLTLFFHDVTDRKRAGLALEVVTERLAVLAEAGPRLAGSLRPEQVVDVLADLIVPDLAASFVLAVTDSVAELLGRSAGKDPNRLHVVAVRHRDATAEAELRGLTDALELRFTESTRVGRAARTGLPDRHVRVPDEVLRARAAGDEQLALMRRLNTGPQLSVPLNAPSGLLGAFTVSGSDDAPLDEVLLLDLAGRASVALENALSFARQHRAATILQRALLPRTAPRVPDVEVATRYLPASEHALAGGDFFKTVTVDGRLVCALGDVMGHGTASAARAGQLHGLVAALALQGLGPGEVLGQLSRGIEQMMDLELATLLIVSYDPATRMLTAATAGHPPPLVAPVTGQPLYLDLTPGPPIGVATGTYADHTVQLPAGSTMVLYSDGLVERRGESVTDGLERLRQGLSDVQLPPEAVADHVLRECGGQYGAEDDIALLVLRHL